MSKPIVISVDSSKSGIGVCLMQDGHPVCYASKALTKTEQRYAQIEKELYACVFACERFYAYIYGRDDVTIETDHKPLITIIKKPIVDAPSRLQRMLLRLQRYTFNLVFKPGKHLFVADTLSRAYEPASETGTDNATECRRECDEVCTVVREVGLNASRDYTDSQFVELQKQTELDEELVQLRKCIMRGWPSQKKDVDAMIKPYWNFKEDLTVAYGLIWKGDRIVIPKVLRREILKKIHMGHLGLEKCKLRAREIVFWPNINNELKNLIDNCQVCLSFRKQNSKQELIPHEVPERSWEKVGVDLFQLKGKDYLLLVDYFSKFVEIIALHTTTSENIIDCLKNIFMRQGIPKIVMSDCGPQFSSTKFKEFSTNWCFNHVTSSPHFPQSNGQIERTIQTVKNIMKKTLEDRQDYRLALLEYLNTPLSQNLASPAELLQSRKFRTILPISSKLLTPMLQKNVRTALVERQTIQKHYFNRHTVR